MIGPTKLSLKIPQNPSDQNSETALVRAYNNADLIFKQKLKTAVLRKMTEKCFPKSEAGFDSREIEIFLK